jgi:hypothetical protein
MPIIGHKKSPAKAGLNLTQEETRPDSYRDPTL